jgi:hypothetical protein
VPHHPLRIPALIAACTLAAAAAGQPADPVENAFANPPHDTRPWVWGHWLHGNVSKECITRELAAMKRAGLCGMTMFDVAQPGIPAGPHAYMGPSWQEHFAFQVAGAERVGLEVMSHLGPGYSGTGGPWIPPQLASQRIYERATRIKGPQRFSGSLPQPETPGGFFRDVAVLAIRESAAQAGPNIADLDMKRVVWLNYIRWKGVRSAPPDAEIPAERRIPPDQVIDLSGRMSADGRLDWQAPPGQWTILRFGHGWTGQKTLPASPEGTGPECDKLDKRGIRAHFDQVMKRMVELAGPRAGKTFHTFFMDSWEAGGQNWTESMPAEFKRRRGYDIIPWLPVLTGRVLGDLNRSERFLYDLRLTVSELSVENFWAELHRLCRANGIRLAAQPYITTGQDLDTANHLDEPMGEFWSHPFQPNNYLATVKLASSAANLNGRLIVGAEAFTAAENERWLAHPATLKELGDKAFCLGANRFQVHRFAMQRFPGPRPGMTMGKWGQHYDSTQTWWDWVNPWHDYLARCQYMLRLGPVVTDVLALADEEPLHRFDFQPVPGHGSDFCGPDAFRRIKTLDGRPGIPGGPAYQLITVAHGGTMSAGRLRQLRDLVSAGANLLGEPPVSTPGLENLPAADAELAALAKELWGETRESERKVGAGRVFRGITAADALRRIGVTPSFSGPAHLSWIHRRAGRAGLFFIASSSNQETTNECALRAPAGSSAELWNPLTGAIRSLAATPAGPGTFRVNLPLEAHGSAFVVFRPGASGAPPMVTPPPTTARLPLDEIWQLRFPESSGVGPPLTLAKLASWSAHENPAVRHFSGTAGYRKEFTIDALPARALLDLGRVEIMARVRLNGRDLGILWRPPYEVDATHALQNGRNNLEIDVVNLWPNRLIGDAALPEDAKRDAQGILLAWPGWLLKGESSPAGRSTFVTYPLWKKDDPLQASGLLGPVSLKFTPNTPPAR